MENFTAVGKRSFPEFKGAELGIYRHVHSGITVCLCNVDTMIANLNIIVKTPVSDDKGMAHCLEHLCFLGSERYQTGYLDVFALRCLSSGTNAYTMEDHTVYTLDTLGEEGLLKAMPVFIDHVMKPLLTDEAFCTEVQHIDGKGSQQGVVYCEMQSRENSEFDIVSLELHKLMFGEESCLAFESGGKTKDIRTLTNNEIRDFHKLHYTTGNCIILLSGKFISIDRPLTVIHEYFKSTPAVPIHPALDASVLRLSRPNGGSKTVLFPSEETEEGSVMLGWRGPNVNDVEAIVALSVLGRWLQDTSGSPLYKEFINVKSPWCSEIQFEINMFVETSLELSFSGVENLVRGEDSEEDDDGEEEGDEEEEEEEEETNADNGESRDEPIDDDTEEQGDEEDVWKEQLFCSSILRDKAIEVLSKCHSRILSGEVKDELTRCLQKHKTKLLEALEDELQETLNENIIPYLIYNSDYTAPIKTQLDIMETIDSLSGRDSEYWASVLEKYFIKNEIFEVRMKPSQSLANKIAKQNNQITNTNKTQLGKSGLKEKQAFLQHSIQHNKSCVPLERRTEFPTGVPYHDIVVPRQCSVVDVQGYHCQVLQADTQFFHARVLMDTSQVPAKLRNLYVLFCELCGECDVNEPLTFNEDGDVLEWHTVPFETIVNELDFEVTSQSLHLGSNNTTFSCSSLSNLLQLYTCGLDWELLQKWCRRLLLFNTFTEERLKVILSKLSSEIKESLREGDVVLQQVLNMSLFHNDDNLKYLSAFKQKNLIPLMKKNIPEVIKSLEELRAALVLQREHIMFQFSFPMAASEQEVAMYTEQFVSNWVTNLAVYQKKANHPVKVSDPVTPCTLLHPTYKNYAERKNTELVSRLVGINGIDSMYCSFSYPANVWSAVNEKEFYALDLLCTLLSMSEGVLTSSIRGRGLAYDVGVSYSEMLGFVHIWVGETTSPKEVMEYIFNVIQKLCTEHEYQEEVLSQFNLTSAKASYVYNCYSHLSTAILVLNASLRLYLKGETELIDNFPLVESLTKEDLVAACKKYLLPFVESDNILKLIVLPSSKLKSTKTRMKKIMNNAQCNKLSEMFESY